MKTYWYKLLVFFHFISLSIKFFFFFFLKKTFESILLSLIQKSKIKINPIYLIQSIYHLWCVLNTDTMGFQWQRISRSFISQDHQYTDVGPAWTFCLLSKRNISSHQTSHTLLHQISINSNYLIPARTSLSSNQINKQRNTYLLCHLLG